MRRGGLFLVAGIVVVGALGVRMYGTLQKGGAFSSTSSENVAACMQVRGVMGPEDLQIDHETGLVFVSGHDRRAEFALEGEGHARGGIYLYSLSDPSQGFADLTGTASLVEALPTFRPHGLSLKTLENGEKILMVVNHADDETIEVFDVVVEEDTEGRAFVQLLHRKSVMSDAFVSVNDVVALDAERFYATNDHGSRNGLVKTLEDYFRLNIGSVVYYDGEKGQVALKGQTYANGINASEDGSRIFVAETTDQRVSGYSIDGDTGALVLRDRWAIKNGVDNIDIAEDGSLWVGGHPNMFDFIAHVEEPMVLSPGVVTRIDPESGAVSQVLSTTGEEISGLSVAASYQGKTVIGQVFNDGLLICE